MAIEKISQILETLGHTNTVRRADQPNPYIMLNCPFANLPESPHGGTDRRPSFCIRKGRHGDYFASCHACSYCRDVDGFFEDLQAKLNYKINLEDVLFIPEYRMRQQKPKYFSDKLLDFLSRDRTIINEYLDKRGIESKYIDYEMYHDTWKNNLVLPVRDSQGRLVGAESRGLKDKYHQKLFEYKNTCVAGCHRRNKPIILVEGLTDLLSANSKINKFGLNFECWSTLTHNLNSNQVRVIRESGSVIYYAFDRDKISIRNRKQKMLEDAGCYLVDCVWENGKTDIGNMTDEQFLKILDE
jgi:hypothetical protein